MLTKTTSAFTDQWAPENAALGVHLFVLLYEEPTLRKKFGEDYEQYCRYVNRSLPRLRGWDKPE